MQLFAVSNCISSKLPTALVGICLAILSTMPPISDEGLSYNTLQRFPDQSDQQLLKTEGLYHTEAYSDSFSKATNKCRTEGLSCNTLQLLPQEATNSCRTEGLSRNTLHWFLQQSYQQL